MHSRIAAAHESFSRIRHLASMCDINKVFYFIAISRKQYKKTLHTPVFIET